jgi:hypothetical protein
VANKISAILFVSYKIWTRIRICKAWGVAMKNRAAAWPSGSLVGSAMFRPYRQRGHRLPLWLAFRTERCAPRDQASVTDVGSAVSAAVTEASAMTEATVPEAAMGENAMVKSAVVKSMVKAADEAKHADKPRIVETIRIVIRISIRVPVGVGSTVRIGSRIWRGLRLHGVATRRHALQVAGLVERLSLDGNRSVRGGGTAGNRRASGRFIP